MNGVFNSASMAIEYCFNYIVYFVSNVGFTNQNELILNIANAINYINDNLT